MELSVHEFEARCRQVVEEALARHEEVLLTRDGQAVARLVPVAADARPSASLFGRMAGSARIHDDLVDPAGDPWDADV